MSKAFAQPRRSMRLLLFALAVLASLALPSLAAAATGDVSGTVKEGGVADVGLTVVAYPAGVDPANPDTVASAVAETMSGGVYDLSGLPAGKYTVYALPALNDGYVQTYTNGATTYAASSPVTVTDSTTLTGQNITMVAGGTVTGTITGSAGAGVGSIPVQLYNAGGDPVSIEVSNGTGGIVGDELSTDTATSGTVGSYTITGVPAGAYYGLVSASADTTDNYADVWFGGAATLTAAEVLTVTNGSSTPASQSLTRAAEITGTLNGLGATPGYVYAYDANFDPEGKYGVVSTTSGKYTITDLLPGTYYVEFEPANVTGTGATYFADDPFYGGSTLAESIQTATPITVAAGATATTSTLTLPTGGTLSGTVTANGNPASDVTATLYDSQGNALDTESTGTDGTYSFGGDGYYYLPGNYKVGFSTEQVESFFGITYGHDSGANLAFQYYSNATTLASATLVPIPGGGANTASVNATLVTGGSITGTVTDAATGAGVSDVGVYLEDAQGNVLEEAQTTSRADGSYTLAGIPTGTYYLEFEPSTEYTTRYQTQYYGGKQVLAGSTPVSVTAGQITSGINAALAASTAGPQTVTVTQTQNVPAAVPTVVGTVPKVTGTVAVGRTLAAMVSGWTAGTTYSYQWYASGRAVKGATASKLALTAADYRKVMTVAVTGKLSGYNWTTETSVKSRAVAEGALKTVVPKITGTAKVGQKLAARTGTWTKGTRFTYQWYASRKAIKGATKSTFKLAKAETGKTITVKVTGKLTGYATAAKTSRATGKVAG